MDTQSMATPALDGTYTMHPESQLKPLLCALCDVAFWNGMSLLRKSLLLSFILCISCFGIPIFYLL